MSSAAVVDDTPGTAASPAVAAALIAAQPAPAAAPNAFDDTKHDSKHDAPFDEQEPPSTWYDDIGSGPTPLQPPRPPAKR